MSTRKVNIINFDSIVNEAQPKFNVPQLKSPNSIIINAPRQSGKTNLLLNLLVGENGEPLLYYDKIYLMSLSKSQKKYQFLKDYFEELAEEASVEMNKRKKRNNNDDTEVKTLNGGKINNSKKDENVKVESILKITDKWEDLPQMEHKEDNDEEGEHVLVIFDDVLKLYERDTKFRNYVDTLYIAGRHFKLSPCFITQSYCDLDPTLRKNTSHTFLLGFATRPLLNVLAGAIPICDYKVWSSIFKKHIEYPYDFVLINTNEMDIDKKIWVNQMNDSVPIKELLKKSL